MGFEELKSAIKEINHEVYRADLEDYLEVVLFRKDLERIIGMLETFFGDASRMSAGNLPSRAKERISPFGGLVSGQTLYYHEKDEHFIFAMLWPWQDGQRITLKVARTQ